MKKIVILIVILVVIFVVGYIYILLNHSSQGLSQAERDRALTNLLGRKLNLTDKKQETSYSEYKGKHVSFLYPSNTKPFDDQNKPDGPYYSKNSLDGYIISAENPFLWISVQAYANDSNSLNLEDYSAIRVRNLDPDTYKKSNYSIGNNNGLLFVKSGVSLGTQKEAFFLINGKVYMILVQSTKEELLDATFDKIASSIKFY